MTSSAFSIKRVWLLILGDLLGGYKALLITSAALLGAVVIYSLYTGGALFAEESYNYLFMATICIWGAVLASRAFKELHDKDSNDGYLLIPASSLEKTLARFLPETIGFVVFVLVLTFLISAITEFLNLIVFGRQNALFNFFNPWVWEMAVFHYLILHSFFFLGSAWFRNWHLVKTVLAIVLIYLLCFSVYWLFVRIFYAPYWADLGHGARIFAWLSLEYGEVFESIVNILHYLLPPICWCMAWLRVKETQVSHGV